MSYGYQDYGGNPYDATPGAEGSHGRPGLPTQTSSNYSQSYNQAATPAQGYGASNPYGTNTSTTTTSHQQTSTHYSTTTGGQQEPYGAQQPGTASGYGANPYDGDPGVIRVEAPPTLLSNPDFLSRVEAARGQIRELTSNIGEIGSVHQRLLSSPDSDHGQLDNLVANTQILNTQIQDQIRKLEADALKSGDNTTKNSQIRTLKGHFKTQLEDYQKEEQAYRKRYQDQIAREYRIVNPEASDTEVREASEADWGNEGVFQTAVSHFAGSSLAQIIISTDLTKEASILILISSNRTGQAQLTVLWATFARVIMTSNKSRKLSSTLLKCSKTWLHKLNCKNHRSHRSITKRRRCATTPKRGMCNWTRVSSTPARGESLSGGHLVSLYSSLPFLQLY